ncbi:MAG: heparinase II/III family protein [Lachnospiraceae bacterium]|nr:heparinase II/III family protein [Lachnospiraceae bacterium]
MNRDYSAITKWRQGCIQDLADCARELEKQPIPDLTEELFEDYFLTGKRLPYENVYFERRKRLTVFAVLTGLGLVQDADHLSRILSEICTETYWALPPHVNIKSEDKEHTIDLFAAETSHSLAEIIYRAGNVLSEEVIQKCMTAVMERVMIPFSQKIPYAGWEKSRDNWNAVCNGSVGSAAFFMSKLYSRHKNVPLRPAEGFFEGIIDRCRKNLDNYLLGFKNDGVCLEGIGYFTYGMSFYTAFMELIGADIPVERLKSITEAACACFFPSGRTVSFSDSGSREKYRLGLMLYLAEKTGCRGIPGLDAAARFDSDACYRYMMISRDLDWTWDAAEDTDLLMQGSAQIPETRQTAQIARRTENQHTAQTAKRPENQHTAQTAHMTESQQIFVTAQILETRRISGGKDFYIFPESQQMCARGKSGGGLAFKAGNNAEPHNHNDVGSFMYVVGDEVFLEDLGAGEYTADYFGNGRYGILCNRSLGHNVPLIGNAEQSAGADAACDSFETVISGNRVTVTASIGRAYGLEEKLTRTLEYDTQSESLEICDVISSVNGCTEAGGSGSPGNLAGKKEYSTLPAGAYGTVMITENLVTGIRPVIRGDRIVLNGKKHSCEVTPKMTCGMINIVPEIFRDHEGTEKTVYRIIWDNTGPSGFTVTII